MEAEDAQRNKCEALSQAAYQLTREELASKVQETPGARLCQTWAADNSLGGFWAYTATIKPSSGARSVLALVFRGTAGNLWQQEWREFVPASGAEDRPLTDDARDKDRKVFALWREYVDKLWTHPGAPAEGGRRSMEQTVRSHLGKNGEVWITGHSKGGALATVAAARLVMSPNPGGARDQSRLSVLSFNAPKSLCEVLRNAYEVERVQLGVIHRRLYNKRDLVRRVPPGKYCHAGDGEEHNTPYSVGDRVFNWGLLGAGALALFLMAGGDRATGGDETGRDHATTGAGRGNGQESDDDSG